MRQSIQVGARGPERRFGPLTLATFVRYAGASGDMNPLHFDESAAKKAGYPSVFSQGMHQAALLGAYVTEWFGAESLRRFRVRFRAQVWPGDTLSCSGLVETVTHEPEAQRVGLNLTMVRQTGEIVISGSADVELSDGYLA
jgi:acyl dehydratase